MIRPIQILVAQLVAFVRPGIFVELTSATQLTELGVSTLLPISGEEAFIRDIKCDGRPKAYHYNLHIERYSVLGGACQDCAFGFPAKCLKPQCITGDGFYRGLISVNRQLPAPAIQACRGDRIIVDVENLMPDASVTIHWHGVRQNGYQYYDGVPFVTQCPIQSGTTFRYDFLLKDAGTFLYYSHTGVQRLDGFAGPLIVRDKNDSQSHLYDADLPEHVIFISDWYHKSAEEYIPGFNHPDFPQVPETYLINGRGMHWANNSINLPLAKFVVSECKRYRFRLIGGVFSNCPVEVIFQGHKLLVISADGNLKFKPKRVDSVVLNSGDRFDVVLEANQEVGNYYIYAVSTNKNNCGHVRQVAILKYVGSDPVGHVIPPPPPNDLGIQFNAVNSNCDITKTNLICISHMVGEENVPSGLEGCFSNLEIGVDFYYYYDSDLFRPGTYQQFNEWKHDTRSLSLINNVSFQFPKSNLLTQLGEINQICSSECGLRVNMKPCRCTNIYQLPYQATINMILYDNSPYTFMRHSFHLHGFNFFVLEQGVFPSKQPKSIKMFLESLMEKMKCDNINTCRRPQRDTITIPSQGYVLIRFYTDNPGYWLLNSNHAFNLHSGMAILFKVGFKYLDLPPVPQNFPRCGDFLPPI